MTPLLKNLLNSYGKLYVTVSQLHGERPGNKHKTLDDYYSSLGPIEPQEPMLVVKIRDDGESRFVKSSSEETLRSLVHPDAANVSVLELPEDEFYFFQAFRPALFDLDKQLPEFLLQMALVYAYAIFENYIAEAIRIRLRAHPEQVGLSKQITVEDLLKSESKEDLVATVIDCELRKVMQLPITAILEAMRKRFGLRSLSSALDHEIETLSLKRNCLIHNNAKVDAKLAAKVPGALVESAIEVDLGLLNKTINMCRKFCADVDRHLEQLDSASSPDDLSRP